MNKNKQALTSAERLDWLRLQHSENVGPITFQHLLSRYGNVGTALAALPDLARHGGRQSRIRVPSRAWAEKQLTAISAAGARMIASVEPDYPDLLAEIPDPPPSLVAAGHISLLKQPAIGIVGARNASAVGQEMTKRLSRGLGDNGFIVISGLARGIDTAAHKAALPSGTIAVVAGGIDVVYPRENKALLDNILEAGAVVSEMLPGQQPIAKHFPRRNRIISGLSRGIVVVEAQNRSGSMITARLALEQNREVMAVPGFPLEPRAAGPNRLIKQGAALIENVQDICQAVAGTTEISFEERREKSRFPGLPEAIDTEELAKARPRVKEALGMVATSIDDVIENTGLTSAVVLTILLELELAGRLDRYPGFRVSLNADIC